MQLINQRGDRGVIAAVLLVALHLLWMFTLLWGTVIAAPDPSLQWPLSPGSYDLEVITAEEFEALRDPNLRELTFANGRTLVRTPELHALLLSYYQPINHGEQLVRLSVKNDVIQELRNSDAVKLLIVTFPAVVLSLWNLAIAVRCRVEEIPLYPADIPRSVSLAAAGFASPQETPDAIGESRESDVVPVQPTMPPRSMTRRIIGIASIVSGLVIGLVVHRTWGHFGGLFWMLSLYVIAPFSIIGVLTLFTQRSAGFLIGAALGCVLTIAPPFAQLIYDTWFAPPGGGADIGLGLMLFAVPVVAPAAALMGGLIGNEVGRIVAGKWRSR